MKTQVLLLLLTVSVVGGVDWLVPTTRAEAPSLQQAPAAERTVWYFYRVKWGYQDEFLDLYQTNHYPVIKAQLGGRVTEFKAYGPMYHGDGRSDWTFATVMTFRDDAALTGPDDEMEIAERLFPDFDTFKTEEQHRFELLDAHWDVPLTEIDLEARELATR